MIRHLAFKSQTTKPPIAQVQMDFVTQPSFRANGEAITDDRHPYHQLRINRRAARVTVEIG
jgi:hypothetical protein